MKIVSLFARHGESDYASACLQKMASVGDLEALFQLAEQELDGGRATTAWSLFQSVFDAILDQGRRGGRLGSDDVALAVKALIGSWTIARRNGDDQRSTELLREIRLALCSPSTGLRSTVADYLGERDEANMAMEAYEVLLPMTVFGNDENTGLYDVARNYSLACSQHERHRSGALVRSGCRRHARFRQLSSRRLHHAAVVCATMGHRSCDRAKVC